MVVVEERPQASRLTSSGIYSSCLVKEEETLSSHR